MDKNENTLPQIIYLMTLNNNYINTFYYFILYF